MTNAMRVLLWTDGAAPYQAAIAAAGLADRVVVETLKRTETPSPAQLAGTDALLAWGVAPGVLPRFEKLRWAQALTAGVEGWLALPDLPPALTLTCARGTHGESMAENILGAVFSIAKPFAAMAESQSRGTWERRVATPLAGATLGILGVGAIGAQLAGMASAVGMRVVGTRRRPGEPVAGLAELFPPERTAEVLGQSDYVVLLLPATPETENFMDATRLGQMKPSAWLLNFGRGGAIEDAALVSAVTGKTIAGAVLDVFRVEPLPEEHAFWTTPGIRVLPHMGGMHPRRDTVVAKLFVENLARFLDGRPLREVVDRKLGY
jgi:phosphoglycerate dehydrogenase-like enzyme